MADVDERDHPRPAESTDGTAGYYMLFVLNQANVPSIARIVRLE